MVSLSQNDETKRRRRTKCKEREREKREEKEEGGEKKIALTFDGMVDIMVTLCPRAAKAFINA